MSINCVLVYVVIVTSKELSIQRLTSSKGVIGDTICTKTFVTNKVKEWSHHADLLSNVAKDFPQLSFIAMTISLQLELKFIQQVIPMCALLFHSLETALSTTFLPTILSHTYSPEEHLMSLPIRMGGLGISNPVLTSSLLNSTSRKATSLLTSAIKDLSSFSPFDHITQTILAKQDYNNQISATNEASFNYVLNSFDPNHQRGLLRSRELYGHGCYPYQKRQL